MSAVKVVVSSKDWPSKLASQSHLGIAHATRGIVTGHKAEKNSFHMHCTAVLGCPWIFLILGVLSLMLGFDKESLLV